MATVTFKGNQVQLNGDLPKVGQAAPDATLLVDKGLATKSLSDFKGQTLILTVNPSYDTGVCMATARAFNAKAGELDAKVLMISADLPFAQKRFCEAEGLEHVIPLSTFRSDFVTKYGLEMQGGPLAGLSARAVIVIDRNFKVAHAQLVPEIVEEPNYADALSAAKG